MPPDDLQLDELTNATLMKLEQFRDRTATGQLHIQVQTQTIAFQALSQLSDEQIFMFLSLFGFFSQHTVISKHIVLNEVLSSDIFKRI